MEEMWTSFGRKKCCSQSCPKTMKFLQANEVQLTAGPQGIIIGVPETGVFGFDQHR
jgi:hypothetical protein